MSDVQALMDTSQAPSIKVVAPVLQGNTSVSANGQKTSTTIYGVTTAYAPMRNETVTEGAFFNDQQVNTHARVAVIGPDLATTLFGRTTNLVGQTLRINSQTFTVIGILASKVAHPWAVLTTRPSFLLPPPVTGWSGGRATPWIRSTSRCRCPVGYGASAQISNIMRLRHKVKVGSEDFSVFSQQDILQTATSITGILTIFLGGIAAISLLVGGIGIMNIMLVSVAERTREIGLRKAVGARTRDIMLQFLVESSFLSLMGGLIGILLGWLISLIIGQIAASSGTALNPAVSWNAILLATLFSAAVGLFFGIYPARRASRLEPVEALRYE